MKTMYQVLTIHRSTGYSPEHGFLGRSSWQPPKSPYMLDQHNRRALPVNGAPMRAKDTLLAQLIRSSGKSAAALLNGHVSEWTRESAHYCKARNSKDDEARTKSAIQRAKELDSIKGRLLGVEIECYPGNSLPSEFACGLGDVVHDGSLDGVGREIRRITWSTDGGRIPGLLSMKPMLQGAKVNKKCGLHVHVDARHLPKPDHGTSEICDVAETYDRLVVMSKFLKKLIPRSRWNNRYCKFANNRDGSCEYNSRVGRYAAINWESYSEHGTIEFRCGAGSTNIVKIESWALLCQHLLNFCSRRENQIPRSWQQFLAILPGWLSSWCALRHAKLYGGIDRMDERVASAADFDAAGTTVE